ncbi:MAG: hypothetical protein Q4D38_01235 [Planctomycetia bacterium]|nr:hypothetical protein [Planctomycetia bacterium]
MSFIKNNAVYLLFACAAVVVFFGAIIEGQENMRWGNTYSTTIESFDKGIQEIPIICGDWIGDDETEQRGIENEYIRAEAGAEGSLARQYQEDANRQKVEMNIICGYSRKVAIHTPTRCYVGSGYNVEGKVTFVQVPYKVAKTAPDGTVSTESRIAHFRTALFVRGSEYRRVYWAWKTTEPEWVSPWFPRFTWRSATPLCKLYLSEVIRPNEDVPFEKTAVFDFAKAVLPEIEPLLDGKFGLDQPVSSEKTTTQAAPASSTPKVNPPAEIPLELPALEGESSLPGL